MRRVNEQTTSVACTRRLLLAVLRWTQMLGVAYSVQSDQFTRAAFDSFASEQPLGALAAASSLYDCGAICGRCSTCVGFAVSAVDVGECRLIRPSTEANCSDVVEPFVEKPLANRDDLMYFKKVIPRWCISCHSDQDPSCTETTSPSTTVSCHEGACYMAKHQTTGAISRGCRSDASLTGGKMLHPPPAVYICSSDPPGISGPYICVCSDNLCNANEWSVMGGTTLKSYDGFYDQVFICQSDSSSVVCFMDSAPKIRGCTTNPLQCK